MNRILLFLALAIAAASPVAATPITEQADSAYSAEDYPLALALYLQAADSVGTSAGLYYNIGNTYYRLNQPGRAIVNYERALRLDPRMTDAATNLAFVNSRIVDRPGERGTFVGNALDAAALAARPNTWAWLALVCFTLAIAGLVVYIFTSAVTVRKVGFFGAAAMVVGTAVFVFFAVRAAGIATDSSVAVVTKTSTILSTSPRQPKSRTEEAMLLHEGTRVEILDSVRAATDSVANTWLDVRVDNSHRAWINSADVERVISPAAQ